MQCLGALSGKGRYLLFDSGEDYVPEWGVPLEVCQGNIVESIANLEISEVFWILFKYEGIILNIMATHKCSIGFMEDMVVHIVEVIITSGVNHSRL